MTADPGARTDQVLQYALAIAALQDDFQAQSLGPIHLIKYVYLADLAHARSEGQPYTPTKWRFHNFGPWSAEVFARIEPALDAIHASRTLVQGRADNETVRYRLKEDADHVVGALEQVVPWKVCRAVRQAVHEYGSDTAGLLRHVYLSPPMLKAAPGEMLVLTDTASGRAWYEPAQESSEAARTGLGKKKRRELLAAIREGYKERRQKLPASRMAAPALPPRYDDVFLDGAEWLDELAGPEVTSVEDGVLEIDPGIWTSSTRRGPDVS